MSIILDFLSREKELELNLVLYGPDRAIFFPLNQKVGVHLPPFEFNPRFRIVYGLRVMWFIRTTINKLKPTRVVSFGEYWNSFILLALFGTSHKVVVSDRSQPDKPLGPLHDFLRRWLYPRAEMVIAQTELAREVYRHLYRHPQIRVIGNPIRQIGNGQVPRENIILSVGRLIKSKNHEGLIRTFLSLPPTNWKLVIVGYDHLGQRNHAFLEQLVRDLGGEGRVEITGKLADVDRYYQQAKIFAFMSRSEGFPNAIGEAMSAGLPVVAFDCPAGPADMIVNGRNGFLVPLDDYDTFRLRLQELMTDENQANRMGEQARVDIQRFSIEVVGRQYLDVFFGRN